MRRKIAPLPHWKLRHRHTADADAFQGFDLKTDALAQVGDQAGVGAFHGDAQRG